MIELKYGREALHLEAPSSWTTHIVEARHPDTRILEDELLSSLDNPYGSKPFLQWIKDKKRILLIVSDITRYTGAERVLPILKEKFLAQKDVTVLFALGNHRKQTGEEQRSLVSDGIFESWPCIDHDCFDDEILTLLGTTTSGLEMKVNKHLHGADAIIVTGAISFHYLAGFGGGRKCIIPGVSGYRTILEAHKRVFNIDKPGKHELAQTGILAGNPMHDAIMEGIALIDRPMFLINTVFDDKKDLLGIFAGDIALSHEAGCAWYNEHFAVTVKEKCDVAVVSVGGFPKDIDFIQTHKALEHVKNAVKDGGTIILVGKCEDGIGNSYFMPWFDYPTIEAMEPHVRSSEKIYAQTAYSTRIKTNKFKVIMVSDLDDNDVLKMGMIPKKNLNVAIESVGGKGHILCYVIPEGSKTLIIQP
jgi:lactate racemase